MGMLPRRKVAALTVMLAIGCMSTGCIVAPGLHFETDASTPPVQSISAALIDAQARAAAVATPDRRIMPLLATNESGYRVGPRDVLSVSVWNHPQLAFPSTTVMPASGNAGFPIDDHGRLRFPLIGAIAVAGMEIDQIRDVLTQALSTYLHDPQVAVRVADFRYRRIFVDGAVLRAGAKPITDVPMNLALALSEAGGMTADADRSHLVLTRNGEHIPLDLPWLATHGITAERIALGDDDLLHVHSREEKQVFVAGEVGTPSALPMREGKLDLGQALALSGSVSPTTGNPHGIYVIRPAEAGNRDEIFQLDARSPVALALASRFELRPKDLVYVETSGLARWSRMTGLLLSTSQTLYNTRKLLEPR
jgi:polysaccharide export outer membrane protein